MSTLSQSLLQVGSLLTQGDVDGAREYLDRTHSELLAPIGSTPEAPDQDVFDTCCLRASIAAMEGVTDQVVAALQPLREYRDFFNLRVYLEGVAALSRDARAIADIKFTEVLSVEPDFVLANLGLAAVHYLDKKYQASFAQFRIVLQSLGNDAPPISRIGLALCAYKLNDTNLAWKCTARALEVNPSDFLAKMVQLVLLMEQRNISELVKVIQDLRRTIPKNVIVLQRVVDVAYMKAIAQKTIQASAPALTAVIRSTLENADITESQKGYSEYQLGRLRHACGELNESLEHLDRALAHLPELTAASIHRAKVLYKLGQHENAITLLRQLDASRPAEKEILEMLAVHSTQNGLHEAAIDYSRRLVELAPEDTRAHSIAAWCNRIDTSEGGLVHLTTCKAAFEKRGEPVPWVLRANIASLDPNSTEASIEGLIHERLEQSNGADASASEASSRDAAMLLFNLALRLEQTDVDRAQALYVRIVKTQVQLREAYIRLYEIAVSQGRHQQALRWLALLKEVDDSSQLAQVCEARTLSDLGLRHAAVGVLSTSKSGPSSSSSTAASRSPLIALAAASIYLWCAQQPSKKAAKQLDYAVNRYQYALSKDPSNVLAAHGLACALGISGVATEANLFLDRVRELPVNDPYILKGIENHINNVRVMADSYQPSIPYLDQLSNKTPAQYSALAYCLAGVNQYDRAVSTINEALEKFPDNAVLTYNASLLFCAGVLHAVVSRGPGTQVSGISDSQAEKLRSWMAQGLEHAKTFVSQRPQSFEGYSAASKFVNHVARFTYAQKERIHRLQQLGVLERRRMEHDSNEWKSRHAKMLEEQIAEKDQRNQGDEGQTQRDLEILNLLREKTEIMRQSTTAGLHPGQFLDYDNLDAFPALDGDGMHHEPMVGVEDLSALEASTFAVGGMRVDDTTPAES